MGFLFFFAKILYININMQFFSQTSILLKECLAIFGNNSD